MADYRRMVSYMYQYEDGVKRKNTGFARIETRGGQCKITLHMQLLGQLDSIFPVYLIQRGNNNLDLIYLGDAVLKNQLMDSRLIADENNIMGSGFALSDMGGLLLFLNDKVFFATEWDDKPVIAKEVLEALKPKPGKQAPFQEQRKTVSNFREEIETAAAKQEDKSLKEQLNMPSYMLPGGWKMVERRQYDSQNGDNHGRVNQFDTEKNEVNSANQFESLQAAYNQDQSEISTVPDIENIFLKGRATAQVESDKEEEKPEADLSQSSDKNAVQAGNDQIESERTKNDQTRVEPTGAGYIPEYHKNTNWFIADHIEEILAEIEINKRDYGSSVQDFAYIDETKQEITESEAPAEADREASGDEIITESEVTAEADSEALDDQIYPNEDDKIFLNKEEQEQEYVFLESQEQVEAVEKEQEMEGAKRFFDHYPRIYPFEDNEIILCVKIEPKDIGLLPKEIWPYSNNSFLMHGFYCYHHLIFAKMNNRYGYRYILGVPGIYHDREQFMARMFGFEFFKSIRKRELRQGDFGYWYLPVYL